ncbi:hypothetical protein DF053_02495 [Burkholderia cepacia]|nr:hypothetical protein DF053_02495 [Burkholderia cepacia]
MAGIETCATLQTRRARWHAEDGHRARSSVTMRIAGHAHDAAPVGRNDRRRRGYADVRATRTRAANRKGDARRRACERFEPDGDDAQRIARYAQA